MFSLFRLLPHSPEGRAANVVVVVPLVTAWLLLFSQWRFQLSAEKLRSFAPSLRNRERVKWNWCVRYKHVDPTKSRPRFRIMPIVCATLPAQMSFDALCSLRQRSPRSPTRIGISSHSGFSWVRHENAHSFPMRPPRLRQLALVALYSAAEKYGSV